MVKRNLYLRKLLSLKDQPLIKVLTGMRRVGKSTLLDLLEKSLKQDGVAANQIIHLNFEWMRFDEIKDYRQLYTFLQEQMHGQSHVYLMLDEIQLVDHWERAINSIFAEGMADIYLTGSNAKLLSSEIATLLSGRYALIEVYRSPSENTLIFCLKQNVSKQIWPFNVTSSLAVCQSSLVFRNILIPSKWF